MKLLPACLLISLAVSAHSQTASTPAEAPQSHTSIAEFGLVYPLSSDWVRATELLRRKFESANSQRNFDVLLAAVYVPKSNISPTSPYFSLFAYRQPAADCKKSLEAMIANAKNAKDKPDGGVREFSAAGRNYYRLNLARGSGGRHQCMICSTANGHLLVWNAGAPNEKGLDAVVATLNSIIPLPPRSAAAPSQPAEQKDDKAQDASSASATAPPQRVQVSAGLTTGLLIKKVAPVYPTEARSEYIQGTVLLRAEISKTGDIVDLELLDGPVELAGSAVAAVRQWSTDPTCSWESL